MYAYFLFLIFLYLFFTHFLRFFLLLFFYWRRGKIHSWLWFFYCLSLLLSFLCFVFTRPQTHTHIRYTCMQNYAHSLTNTRMQLCVCVREEDLLRRKWSVSGGVREMATQFAKHALHLSDCFDGQKSTDAAQQQSAAQRQRQRQRRTVCSLTG